MSRKPSPAKKAARDAVETQMGFIYVAECTARGLIKIGFSLTPEKRMRALFTKRDPGRLLAKMPGRVHEERKLHAKLRRHHVGWECYRPSILNHPACRAIFQQVSP
jgi:hypothetical protein